MRSLSVSAAVVCAGLAGSVIAAPVALDGVIGSEWAAITPEVAVYSAAAPTSNFQAPTNLNHLVAYNLFLRADAEYVYSAVQALPQPGDGFVPGNLITANLYMSIGNAGAIGSTSIGVEVTNDRWFVPGGSGYFNNAAAAPQYQFSFATNAAGVVEFAAPIAFFTDDPLGMGFTRADAANPLLTLRLSQSLGYSVIGGTASYGDDRLGQVTIPAPAGALALAATGLLAARRRRTR